MQETIWRQNKRVKTVLQKEGGGICCKRLQQKKRQQSFNDRVKMAEIKKQTQGQVNTGETK